MAKSIISTKELVDQTVGKFSSRYLGHLQIIHAFLYITEPRQSIETKLPFLITDESGVKVYSLPVNGMEFAR